MESNAPWEAARTHADVDAAVPEGTTLPDGWDDMKIDDKKLWLNENVPVPADDVKPDDKPVKPDDKPVKPDEPDEPDDKPVEDGAHKLQRTKDY